MTNTFKFVEEAKASLDVLDDELNELEGKVKAASEHADEWSTKQVHKLKKDLHQARTEMDGIAERIESEGEASVKQAKEQAERHWEALQAAVKAYRGHLNKTVAK